MGRTSIRSIAPSAVADAAGRADASFDGVPSRTGRAPAMHQADAPLARADMVDEQSSDSFPASDPPSWGGLRL